MTNFLSHFRQVAESRRHELPAEAHHIRGVGRTNYVLRLTNDETTLHLNYLLVQTIDQGCCYFEAAQEDPGYTESLLGTDVFDVVKTSGRSMQIAALDAVFGALCRTPDASHVIDGQNFEKAGLRAAIVCNEAVELAKRRVSRSKRKLRIVNVGVV